jgi:hypothetical protein
MNKYFPVISDYADRGGVKLYATYHAAYATPEEALAAARSRSDVPHYAGWTMEREKYVAGEKYAPHYIY